MPLKPGSSKGVVSQNIREFHTGKTYAHTAAKFGKERANKQAIAVALSTARKYGKADGGRLPNPFEDVDKYTPKPLSRETEPSAALDFWRHPSPTQVIPIREKAFGGPNLPHPKQPGPPGMNQIYKPPKATFNQGEGMERMVVRGASYGLRHEGMINSAIPGRTDKLPMNVKSGSYILPADIPSALGQGNTMAGGAILKKMFSSGPYGMGTMHGSGRVNMPHMNFVRPPTMSMGRRPGGGGPGFAAGGTKREQETDSHVPIIAAGGEYIIHPDVVRDIGHGDIKAGHRVLDQFVLKIRKSNIETLKKLKPPKK